MWRRNELLGELHADLDEPAFLAGELVRRILRAAEAERGESRLDYHAREDGLCECVVLAKVERNKGGEAVQAAIVFQGALQ